MSNEPTLIGTPVSAAGWHTVFDHASGLGTTLRVRLLQGPRASLGEAMAEVAGTLQVETIDPSVSTGTAWASMRVVYRTLVDGLVPLGELKQPLYVLSPQMESVDIRAHPELILAVPAMPDIEESVAAGKIEGLGAKYANNPQALRFARLWISGVTHFERQTFLLSVTRYYIAPPYILDYTNINRVFSWATILTNGNAIPANVTEPRWQDVRFVDHSYAWRLASVTASIQRRAENVITWQFDGREHWAEWLYPGGSWEPGELP